MTQVILIGLGGLIGAVGRYALAGLVQDWTQNFSFPYGTLVVNAAGCLTIGFVSYLAEARGFLSGEARAAVFIGLLGGFTTFSTFMNESFLLLREGEILPAAANIVGQVVLGLGAVWLGRAVAFVIWR